MPLIQNMLQMFCIKIYYVFYPILCIFNILFLLLVDFVKCNFICDTLELIISKYLVIRLNIGINHVFSKIQLDLRELPVKALC